MPIRRRVVPVYLSFRREHLLYMMNLRRRRRGLPPELPPRRQLFVEQVEGHTLSWLPIFQLAPLAETFRQAIANERDLLIKTVRLERDREPEAIIIRPPLSFVDAWGDTPITDYPERSFTKEHQVPNFDDQWIGMTRDLIWVDGGPPEPPALDDVGALSLYVNQLLGLDETGGPPRRTPQGPIPDDDVGPLEDLVP